MDFDDDLEWHNMFIRYRSRVQLLMAENMPLHFSYLLTVYEESVLRRVVLDSQTSSVGESIEVVSGRPALADVDPITIERQYVHDLNDQAKSVMGSCPANHWPLLKEFFARIASSMHARLQKMWADVSHIDYDSEPTEEELFYEHLTCVISREYINFLRCFQYFVHKEPVLHKPNKFYIYFLCIIERISGEDKAKALTMTPLGEWLFSNNVGLSSVIMTVFTSLTFRDSLLALRAIALCKALSEKLMECYDDEVGVYMLVCAIRSLQLHGADEVTGTPLIGLVFHVYCALVSICTIIVILSIFYVLYIYYTYYLQRRFSDSLPQVLMQIPEVTAEIVETFDSKVLLGYFWLQFIQWQKKKVES
ncbi:hypothetical protein ANCDUO_09537 [Ancylostoma duodenale]|uniref:Uncharacterized protein n=1 Tax=Ancylostoma duodenale TaxID=51022 RepID=A0A0C2GSU7_9BILA|nr:hypothetical protein ANCDUO_09537 [Ancylostoma duodenale]